MSEQASKDSNALVDSVQRVAVVGAGTMGNGIALVFAQSSYEVVVIDPVDEALERARAGGETRTIVFRGITCQ